MSSQLGFQWSLRTRALANGKKLSIEEYGEIADMDDETRKTALRGLAIAAAMKNSSNKRKSASIMEDDAFEVRL